jgi:hypothetical protein
MVSNDFFVRSVFEHTNKNASNYSYILRLFTNIYTNQQNDNFSRHI